MPLILIDIVRLDIYSNHPVLSPSSSLTRVCEIRIFLLGMESGAVSPEPPWLATGISAQEKMLGDGFGGEDGAS